MKGISRSLECKKCGKLVDRPGYCQVCTLEMSGIPRYEAYLHTSGIKILEPSKSQEGIWNYK